ncbi:hypothetical protein [Bilophila wadsworthia]|uniref:hypothetical protein n=1 Tax=Bilophila wadsworthia TaxID=35833 RepID=UPI0035216851
MISLPTPVSPRMSTGASVIAHPQGLFEGGPQALADDRDHVAVFLSGNGKEAILLLAGFFGTDELKPQAGPDLSREQPGEIAEQGRGEALETCRW